MNTRKIETLHILIPVRIRKKLEEKALEKGVTISWVIRAIIETWRNENDEIPNFSRPRRFGETHVSFTIKLYGGKNELLTYCKCNGGEFSPFLRYLLELWINGELLINYDDIKTVKVIKKAIFFYHRMSSVMLIKKDFYKSFEYWEKNRKNNLKLMKLGLSRRLHPL